VRRGDPRPPAALVEQGLFGLSAEAVTVHPFSQKSNLALGFAETGRQGPHICVSHDPAARKKLPCPDFGSMSGFQPFKGVGAIILEGRKGEAT
jgi:hypothetical protein